MNHSTKGKENVDFASVIIIQGVNEFIKGNGAGFDKHLELQRYRPYYQQDDFVKVTDWASWRTKGIKIMKDKSVCPFCADKMRLNEVNTQNKTIEKVFKSSALKTASEILKYLREGIQKTYINETVEKRMQDLIGDPTRSDELEAELNKLASETDYLNKKLLKILQFKPMSVSKEQLHGLNESVASMKIEQKYCTQFYNTETINGLITDINAKLNDLLTNIGKLKGLFNQHERKLEKLIGERMSDINGFFALAGFPYKFMIEPQGEKQATAFLVPIQSEKMSVKKPAEHLSWGERNSFSLVMFMFEAVSEQADLIVLDDPISAFDRTKKYAVTKRLFDKKEEVSLFGNTVILLTHDLQPIIDFVHGNFATQYHLNVDAKYISNNGGNIDERPIERNDLKNIVDQTKQLASNTELPLYVRVINARKNIELTCSDFAEDMAYQVLSNLVHGRAIPMLKNGDKEQNMSKEDLDDGIRRLGEYNLKNFYETAINELSATNLITQLDLDNDYFRTIAVRLLFERADGTLKELRKEFPGACKFLNETNHIENDYVFQLDPTKFFVIPSIYLKQIDEFIKKHQKEFDQAE